MEKKNHDTGIIYGLLSLPKSEITNTIQFGGRISFRKSRLEINRSKAFHNVNGELLCNSLCSWSWHLFYFHFFQEWHYNYAFFSFLGKIFFLHVTFSFFLVFIYLLTFSSWKTSGFLQRLLKLNFRYINRCSVQSSQVVNYKMSGSERVIALN